MILSLKCKCEATFHIDVPNEDRFQVKNAFYMADSWLRQHDPCCIDKEELDRRKKEALKAFELHEEIFRI